MLAPISGVGNSEALEKAVVARACPVIRAEGEIRDQGVEGFAWSLRAAEWLKPGLDSWCTVP